VNYRPRLTGSGHRHALDEIAIGEAFAGDGTPVPYVEGARGAACRALRPPTEKNDIYTDDTDDQGCSVRCPQQIFA